MRRTLPANSNRSDIIRKFLGFSLLAVGRDIWPKNNRGAFASAPYQSILSLETPSFYQRYSHPYRGGLSRRERNGEMIFAPNWTGYNVAFTCCYPSMLFFNFGIFQYFLTASNITAANLDQPKNLWISFWNFWVAITGLGLAGLRRRVWPPRKPRCHLISCWCPTSAHAVVVAVLLVDHICTYRSGSSRSI